MAGKSVNIFHKLGLSALRRHSANANAKGDADARGVSAKGAEDQFASDHPVKAGPIAIGQKLPKQRRDIGHIGDGIRLALGQPVGCGEQFCVEFLFGEGAIGREIKHPNLASGQNN